MTKIITDIHKDYNEGVYKNNFPFPERFLREGTVIDEEQSVKWNREMVVQKNNELKQQREDYDNESARLSEQLHNDMVQAIMEEYDFNEAQASKIYSYAYSEKHSSMSDVFTYAIELSEFIEEFNKI